MRPAMRGRWGHCNMRAKIRLVVALSAGSLGPLLCAARGAEASSPWLPPRGEAIVRVKLLAHETDRAFCPTEFSESSPGLCGDGDRVRYPLEGRARDRGVLCEAEVGVAERASLDARLTYYDLRFDDLLTLRRSRGLGDLTLGGRVALLRGRARAAPFAAVKIPLADESIAPGILAIGDQQIDVETGLHAGGAFGSAFAAARAGYRFRARNDATGRQPGDEAFFALDLGARAGRVLLRCGFDRLAGEETTVDSVAAAGSLAGATRRVEPGKSVTRVSPGVLVAVSASAEIEIGALIPLAGRNYPASATFVVGISRRFRLWRERGA